MPGWYIHMNAARKAIEALPANAGAASVFARPGLDPVALRAIATSQPAYTALGAIGPDIFFLLPDFKGLVGTGLFGASRTIKDIYEWWDTNFLGPYQDQLGPIENNLSDEVDALTGGLASQISDISSRAFAFIKDTLITLVTRQYDVFSLLGSGVPSGYDERTFFWSDMLHYRKTYTFAAHLWQKASNPALDPELSQRFQAFALGWMSHLATDVTGHAFVNEKAGGPYRLHWQRHHLIENHMDAFVYEHEHGMNSIYQAISCSAMHLWLSFNPDGSSRVNFFDAQPGPSYDPGDKTPAILDRRSKWDFDSEMPDDLATFLAEALHEVYVDQGSVNDTTSDIGMMKDHPMILSDIIPGVDQDGYATAEDIKNTYWWLSKYVKMTSTDFYSMRRPPEPGVFTIPPFPSPPGSGSSDPGPGASDEGAWHDFLEILLAILAWVIYLGEIGLYPAAALAGIIAGAGTYPIRDVLYNTVELPLYNAWLSMHWYLSMTGFVMPLPQEINPGLHTLGVGVTDAWADVQDALSQLDGNLITHTQTEPSGHNYARRYPRDVVTDPPSWLQSFIRIALYKRCGAGDAPSEFLRPWKYPLQTNTGAGVPFEQPSSVASPFNAPNDPTVLFGAAPGNNTLRTELENAKNEADTLDHLAKHLPAGRHLGDPVDYTGYVVASLTRDDVKPEEVANFNLDADRGYGYLSWDWLRLAEGTAVPLDYKKSGRKATFTYNTPVAAGTGWCPDDVIKGPQVPVHDPKFSVSIRYIGRERKLI